MRAAIADLRLALATWVRPAGDNWRNHRGLLAAMALGLVLRGYFLAEPLRYDEAYTFMEYVNQGWGRLFWYSAPNNHVLHTVLVKLAVLIWDGHPAVIRFPAFLAGVAGIPLAYWFCRRLVSERAGRCAAVGMAVMPYLILYGAIARGYSLGSWR